MIGSHRFIYDFCRYHSKSEEARTLILAEFADYIYCCTHMSLTEEDRIKSLELVKAFTSSSTKPLFLAGDMNAEPESGFIKKLQKDFQILSNPKQHTFPAPDPKETIDYIATLKQIFIRLIKQNFL